MTPRVLSPETSVRRVFQTLRRRLTAAPGRKRHLPTLDGWRGVALFTVIACHAAAGVYSRDGYFALSYAKYGTLALDVFFALSGLLICKLLLEEHARSGSIHIASFYIRRFCRIVLTCAAFTTILALLGLMRNGWEYASCLFFFRNYLPEYLGGHYTAHLWSLSVEEHFYLILPSFLLFWGLRKSPYAALVCALGCAVWRFAELRLNLLSKILPGVPLGARSDLRFDAFLWGCLMAFAVDRPAARAWIHEHYRAWMWPLISLLLLYCVQFEPHLQATWMAMLIPVVLVGPMLHPEWMVSRFLDWTPLRYIGRITFSFYLWQQVFLVPTWEKPGPFGRWQHLPWNLVAIAVASVASYYLLERPLTNLGYKLSARTRKPAAAETGAVPALAAGFRAPAN